MSGLPAEVWQQILLESQKTFYVDTDERLKELAVAKESWKNEQLTNEQFTQIIFDHVHSLKGVAKSIELLQFDEILVSITDKIKNNTIDFFLIDEIVIQINEIDKLNKQLAAKLNSN